MKISHKIQEWLADRVTSVQYPNVRPADVITRKASRNSDLNRNALPFMVRVNLFLFGSFLVTLGAAFLSAVVLFIYLLL